MSKAQDLIKNIDDLENITKTQCSDGNWNYDPYMQGMANGMILSLAVIKDEDPKFKEAPDKWLKDKKEYYMSKAQEFIKLVEEADDHLLSGGLDGFNKAKAIKKIQSILHDNTKGIYKDEYWQGVKKVWDALKNADINVIVTGNKYDNHQPPKYKSWDYEIYFKNDKGKTTTIGGHLTASGAGSVEDPLDRYDVTSNVW